VVVTTYCSFEGWTVCGKAITRSSAGQSAAVVGGDLAGKVKVSKGGFSQWRSRQPVLLLLLFITLKEDPWRVFTVPRFPSVQNEQGLLLADISIIEGNLSHILKPRQPMARSPRGRWALTLRDINEKATRSLKTRQHDG
ncbi:hypothetical protein KUCAC02_017338, partial [Chaenocephalus aceratus]